jgi:hypothetical protein
VYLQRMAKYYFHLYDDMVTIDEEGVDPPDIAAARVNAIASIRGLICGDVQTGRLDLRHRIEVTNDNERLFTVSYREALELRH